MKTAEIKPAPGHGTLCPKCGAGQLVTRMVSKGEKAGMVFLGCNNWRPNDPNSCGNTIWPTTASSAKDDASKGRACPKCGVGSMKERLVKKGEKAGTTFFSCSNWRPNDETSCGHAEWPKLPAPEYKPRAPRPRW